MTIISFCSQIKCKNLNLSQANIKMLFKIFSSSILFFSLPLTVPNRISWVYLVNSRLALSPSREVIVQTYTIFIAIYSPHLLVCRSLFPSWTTYLQLQFVFYSDQFQSTSNCRNNSRNTHINPQLTLINIIFSTFALAVLLSKVHKILIYFFTYLHSFIYH